MSNIVKLSKESLELLKNYASINTNILIQKGDTLKTRAINKSILAEARKLEEVFPVEFPIYNLSELLTVIALFKEPVLEFAEKIVVVKESNGKGMKVRYMASSKEIIVYPEKEVNEPEYEVKFSLSVEDLDSIFKSAAAINGPDIQVIGTDKTIQIKVTDKATPASNSATFDISPNADSAEVNFTFNFRTESLKLIPGNYDVSISSKLLAKFEAKDRQGFIWFVPCERDSDYDN